METFFTHRSSRWFWVNVILVTSLIVVYFLDTPIGGRSGSTFIGYTYGGISLLGMLLLMWYGIRKRSYRAARTTLKGALAFHVWLGIALLIIVPLHAAFRFGLNIHTLAYVLMVIVIISGIWGAINYAVLAPSIGSHRGEGSILGLLQQLDNFGGETATLAKAKSDGFVRLIKEVDFKFQPTLRTAVLKGVPAQIDKSRAASLVADLPAAEREDALKLISVVNKKRELASTICKEAKVKFWLKVWLYFHLPVSIALCFAVLLHIIAVFYYH